MNEPAEDLIKLYLVTSAGRGKVTSKSILSPVQNVLLVAFELNVTAVADTVETVIELVMV